MSDIIIAAAQSSSIKGDIEANIKNHTRFVSTAVKKNTDVIIFPELSLTGYEPEIAKESIVDNNDERLSPLKKFSENNNITIIVGAPVLCRNGKPYIGSLIIDSENPSVYLKRHLHPGEEEYFSAGDKESCVIQKKEEKIGIAICADVNHISHAEEAAKNGAKIYAAGVLMMDGYYEAINQLQHYARKYSMAVVMANYNSPTGGHIPAGKSAVCDNKGNLLASASEEDDAMVLLIKHNNAWAGKVITL